MTKFGTMVHDDRQKFEILQIQSAAGILTKRPPNAFVGGPHTRITNPRWRTAAILEIEK